MSYAVQHYFVNGGTDAIAVRVVGGPADAATITLTCPTGSLKLAAANPGKWGERLRVKVDHDTKDKNALTPVLFNLTIQEVENNGVAATESFRNLSVSTTDARNVKVVLKEESGLVRVNGDLPGERPRENGDGVFAQTSGSDGGEIGFLQVADPGLEDGRKGMWALEKADLFNLLCIPPFARESDVDQRTWTNALAYCKKRRAMLIVDPVWQNPTQVIDSTTGVDSLGLRDENAVLYFPRVKMADPLQDNHLAAFAPCGVVAGVIARTDAQRGVWKAPAGQDATLVGVRGLAYPMTDDENGLLNPLGVNCLRTFPIIGQWFGGRGRWRAPTGWPSEWKYLPVRRLALFIEESLYRGTQVGGVRAERRAAVGANPPQRRLVHAQPLPPGRLPGHHAARSLFRQVRQGDHHPGTTSTGASSTSWSASPRSSRPSS